MAALRDSATPARDAGCFVPLWLLSASRPRNPQILVPRPLRGRPQGASLTHVVGMDAPMRLDTEVAPNNFNQFTLGDFETEEESAAALDRQLDYLIEIDLAQRYLREVVGYYTQPRFGAELKQPRIDRIVMPSQKMIDLGWPHGPFGIEIKKSGMKLGPIIAQTQDYGRAIWSIKAGYHIQLEWIFIWPLGSVGGDIASAMAQHRIGGAFGDPIGLTSDSYGMLRIYKSGEIKIKGRPCGNKAGSR